MTDPIEFLGYRELIKGHTIIISVPRSFTIRTRIACWLIGLAGRVMDVQCEIEMRRDGEIRSGDVVTDRFDQAKVPILMTVEYIHGAMAHCVWFDWQHQLHRKTFKAGSLVKADAPSPR
ncbi:hypothetical protein HOY34_11140 [Xinfangfangia sp. D13-10-4-6]|uniref:hypothetical protein n=1 Tax=Pseudogemmobacter hezensis TaxID=2737662 RepID=UPI001555BFC7|nr:hypothetical protein [Pseudogemmobacter hezensis]NPD15757.1 hypothetical protein [Pseudogemmobacter hezensis]